MQDIIKCPKCQFDIPIAKVLKSNLEEQINKEVEKKLDQEKILITEKLKEEMAEEATTQTKILKEKLEFESTKRAEAEKRELDFIKKQNVLEDQIKKQDLEIARKMQEERKLIEEKLGIEAEEKYKLIIAEKDKKIDDQKKLNDEMNRKLHQGSMQTQGEVLETSLEESLKQQFHLDEIDPVPKGISGVDIIQKVIHHSGQTAGIIAWETKRTKTWEDGWIEKAKDNSRKIKADICVIVSDNLPKEIKFMGEYKGVWVSNFSAALGVAALLRHGILIRFNTVLVNTGKEEKKEAIYDYLCSPTFKQKIDIINENSIKMLEIIETEKRWMTKKWATEETRIRRLQENALRIYGEVQGIAGSNLEDLEITMLETTESNNQNETKNPKNSEVNQFNLFNS